MKSPTAFNKVVSDRVTRERTFEIILGREDKKDALGQLAITLDQIMADGFTGCVEIHIHQGHINSVKAKESQKV